MEEGVVRLGDLGQVELVAKVGGVLGEDAVAEEPEDCRVLPLQPQLELCFEFVEFIEVTHLASESSLASKAWTAPCPSTSRSGASSASGSRTKRRSWSRGCATSSSGSWMVASP